jgi:hypothetical protein
MCALIVCLVYFSVCSVVIRALFVCFMHFGALCVLWCTLCSPKPWNGHISVTNYRFVMNQRTHCIGGGMWPFVLFSIALISLRKKLSLDQNMLHPLFWEDHPSKTNIPIWSLAIPASRMRLWGPLAPCASLFDTSCPMLPRWQDSENENMSSRSGAYPALKSGLPYLHRTGKHVAASESP